MATTFRHLLQSALLFAIFVLCCGSAHACNPRDGATFKQCEMYANKGNAKAQFGLGHMFLSGTGVKSSPSQAVYWWRKAAEQGLSAAQYSLGLLYENGEVIEQEPTQAAYWFRKAADQGEAQAQYSLGQLFKAGKGVNKDLPQAAHWFRKAAEQGHDMAQNNLGSSYLKGEGVDKEPTQAAYWFRKAAEQGRATAQYNLGSSYLKGEGVDKDPTQAVYWYRKAAEQGLEEAIIFLGSSLIYSDVAFPQDVKEGLYWLRKGAALNLPASISQLGMLHGAGLGVEKDMRRARENLERAAALWQGEGTVCQKKNDVKSSQDDNYVICMSNLRHLALMLQQGLGGPVDKARADKLFASLSPGSLFDFPSVDPAFRAAWASASLPPEEEQVCRSADVHGETITLKTSPAAKPDRYFDVAISLGKDISFQARDLAAWQQTSDILLKCGIQLRKLRIFNEETCQPVHLWKSRGGSAVPIEYYARNSDEIGGASASQPNQAIRVSSVARHGAQPIAHEFGHLLGFLAHPANFEPNIMQYLELRTNAFSPTQCEAMRRSPLLARLPALPTKRSDTSPSLPAAWSWNVLSAEDRIKQIQPRNKLAALFYEFRPDLNSRKLQTEELVTRDGTLSSIHIAMLAAKYDVKPNQVLRMYEIAHNWPIEAGWPTEKTVFDLSGKLDLFWLPGLQTDSIQDELEKRRVEYRLWLYNCEIPELTADQTVINSKRRWCNYDSQFLTNKRSLRPGDMFTIDPRLSSRIDHPSRSMEIWFHGGDLFYVALSHRGREVVFITPNALLQWDGNSLDEVRKNAFYSHDWENPERNPVKTIKSDVDPTSALRTDNMFAATPATLPGAKTVTPLEVWQSIVASHIPAKRAPKPLILAAMSDTPSLPTAHNVDFGSEGGSFDDEIQKKLKAKIQVLSAQKNQPIVVYCHHESCWLSYNLGLRLVALGYTNVQWMRTGWDGWLQIGLPTWTVDSTE